METDTAPAATIWRGLLAALIAAAVVTVLFIMPAEYGKDPTGIGTALGLTAMANTQDAEPVPLAMEGAFALSE